MHRTAATSESRGTVPLQDASSDVSHVTVRSPKSRSSVLARRRRPSVWARILSTIAPKWTLKGPAAALQAAPSWLISLVLHMLLLLALALWWLPEMTSNVVNISASFAETLGEQLQFDTLEIGSDLEADEQVITPDDLIPVDQPLLAPATEAMADFGPTAASELTVPEIGLALNGRQPGMKRALLAAYGGNARTEAAVAAGLDWLKRNQLRDGTWSLTGPYSDGGQIENPTAATAMGLLAFLGAGNTHQSGEHRDVVKRAAEALVKMQDKDGSFYQGRVDHHRLYSQAQAMIAICELYGMTDDSQFRTAAERSVDYAVRIQDSLGGWRYQPGFDSDTSVSGWFMMGLQSAQMAGLSVPSDTLQRLNGYLDRVASPDGARYGYQPGMEGTYSMTAEALLCRQYLGWPKDDPRLKTGVNLILSRPVNWDDRDVYYWYYATQVLHHLGGSTWDDWNRVMRDVLPANQTMEGPERGSWAIHGDQWGSAGGRLYVTCLSLYMLEVYYRHLPIYND